MDFNRIKFYGKAFSTSIGVDPSRTAPAHR